MSDSIRKRLADRISANQGSVPSLLFIEFVLADPAHQDLLYDVDGLPKPEGGGWYVLERSGQLKIRRRGANSKATEELARFSGEVSAQSDEPGSGEKACYRLNFCDGIALSLESFNQLPNSRAVEFFGRSKLLAVLAGLPIEPVSLVKDPNNGIFAGQPWLAFPTGSEDIPLVALAEGQPETECFWLGPGRRDNQPLIGRGENSFDALMDLRSRIYELCGIDPIA